MLVRENKAPSGSREPAKQSYASFSLAKEATSVDGLFHLANVACWPLADTLTRFCEVRF